MGAAGASVVKGSAQRLRANEQRDAGGREFNTAALRRSLQRASSLAAAGIEHERKICGREPDTARSARSARGAVRIFSPRYVRCPPEAPLRGMGGVCLLVQATATSMDADDGDRLDVQAVKQLPARAASRVRTDSSHRRRTKLPTHQGSTAAAWRAACGCAR